MNKQNNLHKSKYGIFVLLCLCFIFITAPVHADESDPALLITPTPSDYKLPYPGLLPDNPLYFLKSFRDNMMGFFIGKPLDKAEFFLLQSDKQVAASYMLVTQQDKTVLAEVTFSQAQDYFEEAVDQATAARKQGMNVDDIAQKMTEAHEKHLQVLHEIEQQVNDDSKKKFQEELGREDELTKAMKDLRHK